MSSLKTSAGLWPLLILVFITAFLLVDYNLSGGFGTVTRIVAIVGGLAFVVVVIQAIVRTTKGKKS